MKKTILTLFLLLIILILGQRSFGQVTAQTSQQIQLLLQEKNSRTPAQQKIDSRLLQAVREKRGQPMIAGVSLAPANVNADTHGMLSVDISADITDALLSKITALGGTIIYPSAQYHTVRARVNLSVVETIAGYPEVKFIEPAVQSMLVDAERTPLKESDSSADRVANMRNKLSAYLKALSPLSGSVTSQGDATHRADDVRSTFGYLGAGVKIGVISDSYNSLGGASADVASGDLPGTGNPDGDLTPVTVVQDFSGGSDEGRAMLQVIHDLAPKAQLFFATADVSEAGFASNIEALHTTYHCNIILDDVFYFDEPAFQDGIVAQAVDDVTAAGVLYFSSAGNSGSLAKGTSGVFEGDFNDAGSPAFTFPGGAKAGTIHNFGTKIAPVNGDIITSLGEVYNLNWSDAWGKSANDYDLFLVSSTGTIKEQSTNIQSGTQNPYEQMNVLNLASGDRLVVFKTTTAKARALHLNTNRGTLTVATNGQTTGHACAASAFCMAATPAAQKFETGYPTGPYPNPFVSTNKLELFSSDGPRRIFYNANGTAIQAGNFLFATSGGTLLNKPDLTAADGVSTTLSPTSGLNPFYGTSCSAPHAGAIAALLLSGNPALTEADIRTILTSTALDIEGAGYDINSGFGIIQAFQAAQQVAGGSCGTPGGLKSSNITSSGATVSWVAVSGANTYRVDYKTDVATKWTTAAAATTALTLNLSGLSPSTLYDFRVRSNCSSGSSGFHSSSFTTLAAASCNATYDGTVHNTFAKAVAIPFNTNVHGTISTATDVDFYKFTITTAGTITLKLTTLPADYDLYLYNSSQTQIGTSKNRGTTAEAITNKNVGKGNYFVKVIGFNSAFDANDCYTLRVVPGTATLEDPSSLVENETTFSIFPDPASSVLNINSSTIASGTSIKIMDPYGKVIITKPAASYNSQVNVSNLSPGIYVVMIISSDGNVVCKSKFAKQ